jgi:hypothetical protein
MTELDQNYNADLLDAWADTAYEQEQSMHEEWDQDPGYQSPQHPNELPHDQ